MRRVQQPVWLSDVAAVEPGGDAGKGWKQTKEGPEASSAQRRSGETRGSRGLDAGRSAAGAHVAPVKVSLLCSRNFCW